MVSQCGAAWRTSTKGTQPAAAGHRAGLRRGPCCRQWAAVPAAIAVIAALHSLWGDRLFMQHCSWYGVVSWMPQDTMQKEAKTTKHGRGRVKPHEMVKRINQARQDTTRKAFLPPPAQNAEGKSTG